MVYDILHYFGCFILLSQLCIILLCHFASIPGKQHTFPRHEYGIGSRENFDAKQPTSRVVLCPASQYEDFTSSPATCSSISTAAPKIRNSKVSKVIKIQFVTAAKGCFRNSVALNYARTSLQYFGTRPY